MQKIYQILPEYLQPPILQSAIYPNMELESFWTNDWSAENFAAMARAGFLTISCPPRHQAPVLIAQLHQQYSKLEWPELRVDKKVARLVRRGDLAEQGVHLRISSNPRPVCQGIRRAYGDEGWLIPRYAKLMLDLSTGAIPGCQTVATELWRESDGRLIGGEMGYLCGAVYTSLTGFLDRSAPGVRNYGKVQLIALGLVLQQCGYQFWNLGQSIQQYKKDLGACVTPRPEFLGRWLPAIQASPTARLSDLAGQKLSCQRLIEDRLKR
ncbi:hypothetical protein [Cerasicoccus fimbriatus]|uniref:hypothetical protein n=1 Tax=Cerasicoccus fimbriatus TaxID=3014554 RepID=UPI0022B30CF4|nr:hypothetical protein [Cerasicoccus sp. TK19100]